MVPKPLRTKRKSASAARCLRPLGATSAMVTPDRKSAHRFGEDVLLHRCLRKDNPESPVFTGFYPSPGIAGTDELFPRGGGLTFRSWGEAVTLQDVAHGLVTDGDQTVGNILKRHGLPPAPERKTTTTWKEFIRTSNSRRGIKPSKHRALRIVFS